VTQPDARLDYLRGILANRGYAHRSHRLLATHDLPVLRALDRVPLANYVAQRLLAGATKELVLIAAFCCVRAAAGIVTAHLRKARDFGATPAQMADTLLLILPDAGRVACAEAIGAFQIMFPENAAMMQREVIVAAEGLRAAIEDTARSLDPRTKGLVGVVALACLRAPRPMLEARLRAALAAGATPEEVLQALELIITPAGLPVFDAALSVWADVTGAEEIDPTGGTT
jgi:4-carboxymuconolactone decarboxylase